MARIVKERLMLIGSSWSHRKCIDMIFVTKQLVEKVREHNDTLYINNVTLFVESKLCAKRSRMAKAEQSELW